MKKVLIILFSISCILYSQNSDKSAYQNDGTNFFSAIREGNADKVAEMINSGIDVNITDSYGWSALHRAVQANNSEIVNKLLSHKRINLNPVLPEDSALTNDGRKWYADGQTPLSLASYYGYSDIAVSLLNYGADILAKDKIDGAMAIHIAAARGYENVVEDILESYSAKNVKDIVNAVDDSGATPLMWAAMNDKISAMNIILKFGADINAQDDDGWTALHFAAASDSYKAAELLLNNKADANITDLENNKAVSLSSDTDIEALLSKYTSSE